MRDILESRTRLQDYSEGDIESWWRNGLINIRDKKGLRIYPDGRKTIRQAFDEYRKTWNINKREAEARECRVLNILECFGETTRIDILRHSDGEYFKNFLRDKGYKAVSVNKHLQDLKSMFALQVTERAIDFHPFSVVKGMKIPQNEKYCVYRLTGQYVAVSTQNAKLFLSDPQAG